MTKTAAVDGTPQPSDIVIFFVNVGLEMPKTRIDQLTKTAVNKGAVVVPEWEGPPSEESLKKKKTRKKRRLLDLGLPKAYAAYSHRAGALRAHVAWDTVVLSVDDGKTWSRAKIPAAFAPGHSTLLPGQGLAVLAVHAAEGGATLQMILCTPP